MINGRRSAGVFFSILSVFFLQSAFAHQGHDQLAAQQDSSKVIGIVRIDNGQSVCVKSVEGYQIVQNEVPVCSDEQSDIVLKMAQAGVASQTAFLSHAGFAFAGCIVGTSGTYLGLSVESIFVRPQEFSQAGAAAGSVLTSLSGGILVATSEPTGHVLAFAAGSVACAGGLNYVIYQHFKNLETHR